ncbi:MAG TPA: agmatinase [Candidatus Krumholzibacteria bacterium]|nr:agmatinase [Candidatus Krumholzibacteria bacterium]HRX52103.1 agmatinase [Candidatus Krumholzibacteria bacterium]
MIWPLHDDPGAFGGLEEPASFADARFAVLPIPYDGTSTWLKGADQGPQALLTASSHMELYDIETDSEPYRQGIVTMAPVTEASSPEAMTDAVRAAADALLDAGKTVVGLGGEHSVSIGLIQAHAARYPGLTVLQIDAHGDTREEYEGSRCNHACVMARAREVAKTVAVGIRSLDVEELAALDRERVVFAHEFELGSAVRRVLDLIDGPVYVTIDLDGFDPCEMPSTGTPEPGGLRYREVTGLLRAVCAERQVVGLDIVELLPRAHDPAPDFLAARLAYQIMAYLAVGTRGA